MSWSGLCVFVWCPSDRKPKSTQVNSGSLWSLPPPRSHCIPSSSGWGASSEHSPPPSWKREDMRRRQGGMFWASWKHPTNLEWIKKDVLFTLRTSAHPKEVCDPNDRVVQLQLHKLQAETLKITLSNWWKVAGNAWHKLWWLDENVRRKNCWLAEPPDTSQVSQLERTRGFDFWKTWHKLGGPHKQQGGVPSFLRIQGFSIREKWSWFPFVLPS